MTRGSSQRARAIRRLMGRIVQVVAECNEAMRMITTLVDTPARYAADPDRPPDTYAEFLLRTTGLVRRGLANEFGGGCGGTSPTAERAVPDR